MPTANADGEIKSEGSVGEVSVRRVFGLPSDRHGSSAFAVKMPRDIEGNIVMVVGRGEAGRGVAGRSIGVCARAGMRACVHDLWAIII